MIVCDKCKKEVKGLSYDENGNPIATRIRSPFIDKTRELCAKCTKLITDLFVLWIVGLMFD